MSPRPAAGFTLVEVMVALVIIAIGMLGIAKMQALALSSSGESRERALAAIEASSLASAMHANRAYWAAATVAPRVTITGGTAASMDADLTTALAAAAQPSSACMIGGGSCLCIPGAAAPCSAVDLAGSDLDSWAEDINTVLPSATTDVTCNQLDVPVDCMIQMTWTENAVAINNQEAEQQSAGPLAIQQAQYTLYVVP